MPSPAERDKTDRILNTINELRADSMEIEIEEEKIKLVVFTLSDKLFAFYGDMVKEIFYPQNVTSVPGASDFIAGIMNIRGDIESVLNIHKLLGIEESKQTDETRIIMAATNNIRSGILVDSVQDVLDVPEESVTDPVLTITGPLKDFSAGQTFYKDKTVIVLDIGKLFNKFSHE